MQCHNCGSPARYPIGDDRAACADCLDDDDEPIGFDGRNEIERPGHGRPDPDGLERYDVDVSDEELDEAGCPDCGRLRVPDGHGGVVCPSCERDELRDDPAPRRTSLADHGSNGQATLGGFE